MTTIRLRAGQRTIIKLKQVGLRGLQGEQGIQGVAGIDGVDGAVSSVNTQIGDVVLDQDDVLDGGLKRERPEDQGHGADDDILVDGFVPDNRFHYIERRSPDISINNSQCNQ